MQLNNYLLNKNLIKKRGAGEQGTSTGSKSI